MFKEKETVYFSLQAGRAIAALMVVAFHLTSIVGAEKYFDFPTIQIPYALGGSGVHFFFVLSGFVIFTAHRSDMFQPRRYWQYVLKRVVRIYPVYWLLFAGVLFVSLLIPEFRHKVPTDVLVLLKSLLLLPQSQADVGGTGAPVIEVAWTLQVEMVFYTLFSVLILGRAVALIVYGVLVVIFLNRDLVSDPFLINFIFSFQTLSLFATGIVVSWICSRKIVSRSLARRLLIAGVGLFVLVSLDWLANIDFISGEKIYLEGIAFGLIVLGAVSLEQAGSLMSGGEFLQKLGAASYVLYLSHYHVILAVTKIASSTSITSLGVVGVGLVLITALAACLLAALLINRFFEIPVTKWLRKRCVPR